MHLEVLSLLDGDVGGLGGSVSLLAIDRYRYVVEGDPDVEATDGDLLCSRESADEEEKRISIPLVFALRDSETHR
jgi:hypothetical protein